MIKTNQKLLRYLDKQYLSNTTEIIKIETSFSQTIVDESGQISSGSNYKRNPTMVEWAQSASLSGKSVRCSRPRSHARARTLSTVQAHVGTFLSGDFLVRSNGGCGRYVTGDALSPLQNTHVGVWPDRFICSFDFCPNKMMYVKGTYFPFINFSNKRDFKIKDKWVLNMNNFTVKTWQIRQCIVKCVLSNVCVCHTTVISNI